MNPTFLLSVKLHALYFLSSPVTCRNPISPINGSFTGLKKWYLPNDTLPLTCNGDFVPNGNSMFTCQNSGSWSGGQPICGRKYVGGWTTVWIASMVMGNVVCGWTTIRIVSLYHSEFSLICHLFIHQTL